MCLCNKCSKLTAAVVLVIGIVYLLKDIGVLNFQVGIWSVLLIVAGIFGFCSSMCPECNSCCGSCEVEMPKKKK